MSTVDLSVDPATARVAARPAARPAARATATRDRTARFLRSELGMVFGRRRNQVMLAVLGLVPVLIAVAVWYAAPEAGDGPAFLAAITSNGLFVALTATTVVLPLFLPLVVAVVAGDSIAGEAGTGTLRYLLTVPVSRTRVLLVKYAGIVAYAGAAALLVAGVGVVAGLVLFPIGDITLLSGSTVSFAEGLWRVLLIAGYVTAMMAALGAIGLFVSTLTESAIAAMAATAVLSVASQVLDAVPQLAPIGPYLFSHWWLFFGDLLRDPISTEGIGRGLVTAGAYVIVFGGAAWWRFSGKDVTS